MSSDSDDRDNKGPVFSFLGNAFPPVRLAPSPKTRKTIKETPRGAEEPASPRKSASGKSLAVAAPSEPGPAGSQQALAKDEAELARLHKQHNDLKARLRALQTRFDTVSVNQDTAGLNTRIEQAEKTLLTLWEAKKNAELAVLDARAVIKASEAENARTRASAPYQLGQLILDSRKDWRSLLALPRKIFELRKLFQTLDERERMALLPSYGLNDFAAPLEFSLGVAREKGFAEAREWVLAQRFRASVASRVLIELAKATRRIDAPMAVMLARDALAADPSENRIKSLGFMLMDAGNLAEARQVVEAAVAAGVALNETEERRWRKLLALERLAKTGIRCPDRANLPHSREEPSVIAVYAAQTFPFHWTAASMRAHGAGLLAKAAGAKAHVISAPNYPPPRNDGKKHKDAAPIDGVGYHRLRAIAAEAADIDLCAQQTAILLADMLRHVGAEELIAPADLILAYPALIAARLTGVDLVIDAVGPDDLSGESEMAQLFQSLEDAVMLRADRVLVHSAHAAARLRGVGIAPEKLEQRPEFIPMFEKKDETDWRAQPQLQGRFILGYMGEQVEDVDIEAFAELLGDLVAQGHDVGLFVVGIGTRFKTLDESLKKRGLDERALIFGRPRNEMLRGLYESVDLFITPIRAGARRTRWRRFEHSAALAYGCPVLGEGPANAAALLPGSEMVPDRESLLIRTGELARRGPDYAALKDAALEYAQAGKGQGDADGERPYGGAVMRRIEGRP